MEGEDICTIVKVCAFISLTATSLQREREASLPLQATTAALAIVALPLSSAQRQGGVTKEKAANHDTLPAHGITAALSHSRWLHRLQSYTLTQEEQDKPFSNYVKALDCGFNSW